ncbi:Mannosyltransferase [Rhodotorula toruloides ATCC 204091]|uniref:GDP-Man:Man(3)GlcNAc(2)-PP-Dol alpha-1,2-mannosyltransferase n=1 Tax=Rhodotorula toruloides TaxID=5286 RepID=A0A0K3CMH0_RHOTO|nr:Mannosyltransferase [Rhodotorula toruloides ATCC 204091]KAK4330069.1 GDP-Man:Man(3)GlcNAc(2)-PP-Dol alpha-1,2-mannosyltransferase [Rhodotorula toruloides]PRQ71830.1 mannosyltransferase [Rhodotorula toruloides]
MTALWSLGLSLAVPLLSITLLLASLRRYLIPRRSLAQRLRVLARLGYTSPHIRIVGFFHPYCNAGGGGERVLWTALACMQREMKGEAVVFVVYTGDVGHGKASKAEILAKVKSRFDITLSPSTLHFIPLENRWLVEDSTYPRLTLLGQSAGSVLLALEGLIGPEGCVPDVWIDTMGYAFAYPLVKFLCRIPVASYTHYPTISTDMLHRVSSRLSTHTNSTLIASSRALSALKLAYYVVFARVYSWSLRKAGVVWVNSSWTRGHVEGLVGVQREEEELEGEVLLDGGEEPSTTKLRQRRKLTKEETPTPSSAPSRTPNRPTSAPRIRLLYPPCDTLHLSSLPHSTSSRIGSSDPIIIFSLAQFRPEKEHPTQLRALASLFSSSTLSPTLKERVKLVCAGSVRNEADAKRVEALRALASELGVQEKIEFVVNAEYGQICEWMGRASVGLHTMVDEHFGITVVEFQAAGLIPLAHATAGPLLDILLPSPSGTPTGFLAPSTSSPSSSTSSLSEAFAAQLEYIVSLPTDEQDKIREAARSNAQERFSVRRFEEGWMSGWREVVGGKEGW